MSVLERRLCYRWSSTAVLCLFLALMLGTSTRAAAPSRQAAQQVLAAASLSQPMPMIGVRCIDCAACAVAQAPSTHGLSCEEKSNEDHPRAWPEQTSALPAQTWFFDTGRARLRWPVRIAFCRWLD